jgi:hypothetical protein
MKILISCTEKQIFFIEVLDELELFIDKKVIFDEKNVSRIRQKTFYLQFCMGTPEGNEFAG